jgi:voltage-gated potassium channel Kch
MEPDFTLGHVARGFILVTVTVGIQLVAQVILYRVVKAPWVERGSPALYMTTAVLVAVIVLLAGLILQVIAWGLLYYHWGELGSFANCLYFSFASYTTVGAADLTLSRPHRMLGAFESAVGMLMFGWSTALLVQVINVSGRGAAK